MPISVQCAGCGKKLNAPDQLAGKKAKCPKCGELVTIPAPSRAEGPPEKDEYRLAQEPVEESAPPSRAHRAPAEPHADDSETALPPRASRRSGTPANSTFTPATARPTSHKASVHPALAKTSRSARDHVYWVLILALIPLGVSVMGGENDTEARLVATLEKNPDAVQQAQAGEGFDVDRLLGALPGGKIEGAHLPRQTWMHWVYAAVAAALYLGLLLCLFHDRDAGASRLLLIGLFTGTIGILLLLGVQWIALSTGGVHIRGRGIAVLFFYIMKFIGFSYRSALDPENGFFLSFLGFTCGVGFCEEFFKALPLIVHYRGASKLMSWRGACLWGLASGVGFGVSEGITYSDDSYNGLATGGIYVVRFVRFVSCVALHAIWSACVGIVISRGREDLQGDMDWGEWCLALGKYLGLAMVLHGLYDTLLKRDMAGWALATAAVSFAWLVWLIERSRREELEEADTRTGYAAA